MYWHSTRRRPDPNYHHDKYQACRDIGIRLLMINEDEWLQRSHIIKKRILNALSLLPRKTLEPIFQEVSSQTANMFFRDHHLRGEAKLHHALGAFHNNEMIACMAFRQLSDGVELIRYANDGAYNYTNIFSTMLSRAISLWEYYEIIALVDLRYSQGEVYSNIGFVIDAIIPPDYRLVTRDETFHKDEHNAVHRLYDCGKIRFKRSISI